MKLLTRDEFRTACFDRDAGLCLSCQAPGQDAHHIIERRLFDDGGYYLDNAATVCGPCHIRAEQTVLSCEELRDAAGIRRAVIPDDFYPDQTYTKWGDVILDDGTRTPGPLFYDPSVQKILASAPGVLDLYRTEVKHPRTMHLPWSPGVHADDRTLADTRALEQADEVVATVKLDGEQTSMYRHTIHARSIDWTGHPTRDWVKNRWAQIATDIPEGWRVCGENVWARHSIAYTDLDDYFYVHSIWDENNTCLAYDATREWAALLGLETVPELYRGPYDRTALERLWTPDMWDTVEGYVVRDTAAFDYRDFTRKVGKFVRPGHVQTTRHWRHGQPVEPNQLRTDS